MDARPGLDSRNIAVLNDHLGPVVEAGCALRLLPGLGRIHEEGLADRIACGFRREAIMRKA
jgi:hypothetical protein